MSGGGGGTQETQSVFLFGGDTTEVAPNLITVSSSCSFLLVLQHCGFVLFDSKEGGQMDWKRECFLGFFSGKRSLMENPRISLAQVRGRASGLLRLVLKPQKWSRNHNLKGRWKMLSKSLHCLWFALVESCLHGFRVVSTYHYGVLHHGEPFKYFPQFFLFF